MLRAGEPSDGPAWARLVLLEEQQQQQLLPRLPPAGTFSGSSCCLAQLRLPPLCCSAVKERLETNSVWSFDAVLRFHKPNRWLKTVTKLSRVAHQLSCRCHGDQVIHLPCLFGEGVVEPVQVCRRRLEGCSAASELSSDGSCSSWTKPCLGHCSVSDLKPTATFVVVFSALSLFHALWLE